MVALREYSPLDTFQSILSHWWWIVLLALAGGGVGWVFHRIQPPVYEARAVLTVMIDYTQTAPLTEYDQDHTIGIVRAVVLSKDVIDRVLVEAQGQQIPIEELEYQRTIFLERKHSVLELIVRDSNPQAAARLANLWAQVAYDTLITAQRDAVQARLLRGQLVAMEKCLQLPSASEKPEICSGLTPGELQVRIGSLEPQVQEAEIKTMGIIPPLSFEFSQPASEPDRPVAYRANLLTLSGAMIGLVAGVLIVSSKGKSTRYENGDAGYPSG
jgi:uncharacterized protein involved in exopolysaccharide biosynthesis